MVIAVDTRRDEDIRQWIDTAGVFHVEIDPARYTSASTRQLVQLQARIVQLQKTVYAIVRGDEPWDYCVAYWDDVLTCVEEVAPDVPEHTRRRLILATVAAISGPVSDIEDWLSCDYQHDTIRGQPYMLPPDRIDGCLTEAIGVLSHIVEAADVERTRDRRSVQ